MTLSLERIQHVARQTGFNMTTLEKVVHLMNLLEAIEGHPFLRGRFAMEGGTALNLFVFSLARLSADIDLNLVEPLSRRDALAHRTAQHRRCGRWLVRLGRQNSLRNERTPRLKRHLKYFRRPGSRDEISFIRLLHQAG